VNQNLRIKNAYTCGTEFNNFTTFLKLGPRLTHLGTAVLYQPNHHVGEFLFFKITTQNTALGAWRTPRGMCLPATATFYLTKGNAAQAPPNFAFKSERLGSDGFVLAAKRL